MRRLTLALAVIAAILFVIVPDTLSTTKLAAAQTRDRWNRNCREAEDGKMNADTYTGTFQKLATASGPLVGTIDISLSGTFTVTLDEMGCIKTTSGTVSYTMQGQGHNPFARTGLDVSAGGAIDRVEWQRPDAGVFVLLGTLSGRAAFDVKTPGPEGGMALGGSGEIKVEFTVDEVTCDYASGTIRSVQLLASLNGLRGAGYQVEEQPGLWSAHTDGSSSEKQSQLQKELEEASGPASGAPSQSRELVAHNLGKIIDNLRQDRDSGKLNSALFICLYRQWCRHVDRVLTGWIEADTAKLNSYQGVRDLSVLNSLVGRALDADRTVSLLGLDTCHEEMQQQLFTAINKSLSAQLNYLIKSGASAQDLLGLLRKVDLIGQIAPVLRERVEERVRQEAWNITKAKHAAFLAARGAAGAADCPAAAVREWKTFLAALQEYQILGGSKKDYPTPDDGQWSAKCLGQ